MYEEKGLQVGRNGCSFNKLYEYHFPMFKGNLNSGEGVAYEIGGTATSYGLH
jgi:hypothetical protein